jgi:hypothetical protein
MFYELAMTGRAGISASLVLPFHSYSKINRDNPPSHPRAANIDFKTVKRLFRDPYRDVAISTLVKIAWALDVSVADLVEAREMPAKE